MLPLYNKKSRDIEHRRNWDEPLSVEAWRGSGQYLHNSGHPDELYHRYLRPMTLSQIKLQQSNKSTKNMHLLNGWNYNTQGVVKRQQFKGPSDEVHYPIAELGSDWYTKATAHHKGYLTRIVPWTLR